MVKRVKKNKSLTSVEWVEEKDQTVNVTMVTKVATETFVIDNIPTTRIL